MNEEQTPQPDPQPYEGDEPGWLPQTEPELVEKQYIVVGSQAVMDHNPGETFTAKLTVEQERNFLQYGQLALAQNKPQTQEASAPVESEPQAQTPEQQG